MLRHVPAPRMNEVLLDPKAIAAALARVAAEILARDPEQPVVVSIRRGGDPFVASLAAHLGALASSPPPPIGAVDITLYRDDAATALPNPRIGPSRIPVSIDGRRVLLFDDVLHTGRTIRAALDALLDFGRPRAVELGVLVDRGGRELPIQADYVGLRVEVPRARRVEVVPKRSGPRPEDVEHWALVVPDAPPPPRPSGARTGP